MSEPIGNGPRSFAGNSHKSREPKPEKEVRTRPDKVVTGKVTVKKQSLVKRVSSSMFVDDFPTVMDFVVTQVVLPSVKRLILESVSQGLGKALMGTGSAGRSGYHQQRGGSVSGLRSKYRQAQDDIPAYRPSRATQVAEDFVLETLGEAQTVLDHLVADVDRYGMVSMGDLYDYLGVSSDDFTARNFGWTNLDDSRVRQTPTGFVLDLPRAVSLGR